MAEASDIFDQLSAPAKSKADVFDKIATPAQIESHGASGSWDPIRPTFFHGLASSVGVPEWDATKKFLSSAYHHPLDTVEDTAKTAKAVSKFIVQNPGKFLLAMQNVPQIKEAYQKGNYAELSGLLTGTLGQDALTFFSGEGVIPQSKRAFAAGWAGKTADEFAASENAIKAAKTAERANRLSKLADSVKLTITPGERLAGGRLEKVESALRGFPGMAGSFNKLADQRKNAILALHDTLGTEATALHDSAQNLYKAIGERVPQFQIIQDEVSKLRKQQFKAKDPKIAYDIGLQLEDARNRAEEIIRKSGDPVANAAWRHADSLWTRFRAKQDLQETIQSNIIGRSAEKIASAGKTEEAARPPELKSLTRELEDLERDGTLTKALGKQRSDQLIRTASLYDRVRTTGKGYIAERLLGYGIIGALPFLPKGYAFDVAAGAAGGMVISWALMKGGSTTATLDGFLRAAEAGDIRKATQLASVLGKSAQEAAEAAKTSKTNAPRTVFPPMSEAMRLRTQVPLNLQPREGEEPIRDMLTSLLNGMSEEEKPGPDLQSEMEKAGEKKRTQFRTAEELARIKKLAGGK